MPINFVGSGSSANAGSGSYASKSVSAVFETGEMVLVWITYYYSPTTPVVPTVGDGTNTYTKVGATVRDTGGQACAIFQCQSVIGGSYTLTLNMPVGVQYIGIGFLRYTGLSGAAQVVGAYQATPGLTENAVTSGNITPVSDSSLLVGITFAELAGVATLTAGTGFTDRGDFAATLTAWSNSTRIEDKVLASLSPVAATFTTDINSRHITMAIVVGSTTGMTGTPPEIRDISADPVTQNTATINWTSNVPGESTIEFGTTTAYGSTVNIDAAPTITNVAAVSVSDTSERISWDLSENATGQVEYGKTPLYGSLSNKEASFNYFSHSQLLSGLTTGATYHFRVISGDPSGGTTYSNDYTFTVSGTLVAGPTISAVAASAITGVTALISWDVSAPATGLVEYGETTDYGLQSVPEASLLSHHDQQLSGLAPGTTYHYRLYSQNAAGNMTVSGDNTFTTTGADFELSGEADADVDAAADMSISLAMEGAAEALVEADLIAYDEVAPPVEPPVEPPVSEGPLDATDVDETSDENRDPDYQGVDNTTGKALDGLDHLKQSIIDILGTPIGTRVMRRDYGSEISGLIDAPLNSNTIIDIIAATAEALDTWEPRIVIERVVLDVGDSIPVGHVGLTLYGKYLPNGKSIQMDGIIL